MIVTDEFLDESKMSKYLEYSRDEIKSSYPILNFSERIPGFNMKTCVDIGSNMGIFSIFASHHFENVFAFEPAYLCEVSSKIFVENLQRRNVKIYNLAVGAETGKILNLFALSDSDGNFLSRDNTLLLNTSTEKIPSKYETCLTISLNDLFKLIDVDFIDYLKIDCEGSEYDILLTDSIKNIGMISGEIHNLPGNNFNYLRDKLINHLTDHFMVAAGDHNFVALNRKFCDDISGKDIFFKILDDCGWIEISKKPKEHNLSITI